MSVFQIDAGALVAAATALGGALAGGLVAGAKIIARAMDRASEAQDRSTEALMANANALGRNEAAVVERIERESSGVVEVPIAAAGADTPRLRQYRRPDSKPKRGDE